MFWSKISLVSTKTLKIGAIQLSRKTTHDTRRIPSPRANRGVPIRVLPRRNIRHGRCFGQSQFDRSQRRFPSSRATQEEALQGLSQRSELRIKATGLYACPDLSIVCGEPELESKDGEVLLNPIAIVEVLSDSTEAYDRGKKFEHYRTIPSLRHYILIAQDRYSIDCFSRQEDGTWSLSACQTSDSAVGLPSIQCQLEINEVYDKVVFA